MQHFDGAVYKNHIREVLKNNLRRFKIKLFGFFNNGQNIINLSAFVNVFVHRIVNAVNSFFGKSKSSDGQPACGLALQVRNLHIAEQGHRQGTRDRGSSHY
jgi:hypothetical protein